MQQSAAARQGNPCVLLHTQPRPAAGRHPRCAARSAAAPSAFLKRKSPIYASFLKRKRARMRFMYLWQAPGWPALTWDANAVTAPLAQARLAQGRMLGLAGGLGMADLAELQLAGWTQEALATAQIEGEQLQLNSVRASAARRLGSGGGSRCRAGRAHRGHAGCPAGGGLALGAPADRAGPLRLACGAVSHRPQRRARASPRAAGARTAESMQIVTPGIGKPDVVHYEAPPSADVPSADARAARVVQHAQPRAGDRWPGARGGRSSVVRGHPPVRGRQRAHRPRRGGAGAGAGHAQRPAAVQPFSAARPGSRRLLRAAAGRHRPAAAWISRHGCNGLSAASRRRSTPRPATCRKRWRTAAIGREVNAKHPGLSASQRKALARLLEAGPEGFAGGMSTEKYVNLTGTSRATAYRELTQLTELGAAGEDGAGEGDAVWAGRVSVVIGISGKLEPDPNSRRWSAPENPS